jgi:hypothetical protein
VRVIQQIVGKVCAEVQQSSQDSLKCKYGNISMNLIKILEIRSPQNSEKMGENERKF